MFSGSLSSPLGVIGITIPKVQKQNTVVPEHLSDAAKDLDHFRNEQLRRLLTADLPYKTVISQSPIRWTRHHAIYWLQERQDLAFTATGCQVAYPTWHKPVDCVHVRCQIRRGELPQIALLNHELQSQAENWWRFIGRESGRGQRSKQGRITLAKLYRHYRKMAMERKEYDLWKLGGVGIAMVGVMA